MTIQIPTCLKKIKQVIVPALSINLYTKTRINLQTKFLPGGVRRTEGGLFSTSVELEANRKLHRRNSEEVFGNIFRPNII